MDYTRLDPCKLWIGSLHAWLTPPRLKDIVNDILGCGIAPGTTLAQVPSVKEVYMPGEQGKSGQRYAFLTFKCPEDAEFAVQKLAGYKDDRLASGFVKAPVVIHVGPGDTRLDKEFDAKNLLDFIILLNLDLRFATLALYL